MQDVETYQWEGVELPVWRFETFEEIERFLDEFMPVDQPEFAQVLLQLFADMLPEASGVLFKREQVTTAAALAVVRIEEHVEGTWPTCGGAAQGE